jgi:hypothetical protein
VDYVQYNRISFFSGLSSCYEALECIDLSLYKQCRNGSTYVLPIGMTTRHSCSLAPV